MALKSVKVRALSSTGGTIPGYIVIQPDLPECLDDFGFLWFESEYIINVAGKWILAANAADALVQQPVTSSGMDPLFSCSFLRTGDESEQLTIDIPARDRVVSCYAW